MGHDEQRQACSLFLRGVPILSGLDESALWRLAGGARPHRFPAGTRVIGEGEDCHSFYVVRSGQADVLKRDSAGIEHVVARLGCGSYFGELGLLTNRPRSASIEVRTNADLSVYAFEAQQFHEMIAEDVLVFRLQREQRRLRRLGSPRERRLRIRSIDVLDGLPERDLETVAQDAREETVRCGDVVMRQGVAGDRFYVLLSGGLAVERDGAKVATLTPGDFFGETALLFDSPRNATVCATTTSVVWSINRASFQRVVGHFLLSRADASATILGRLQAV